MTEKPKRRAKRKRKAKRKRLPPFFTTKGIPWPDPSRVIIVIK